MRILIALFHVKRKTDIMLTLTYIIVIEILAKTHNFQTFYLIHIMDIPTNKGTNSYKLKILKKE